MADNFYRFQAPGGTVGRILGLVLGLALAVLAFFMFAAFAVATMLFAAIGLVRIWWLGRSGAPRQRPDVLTVEYTVEHPERDQSETALPPASPRS